MRLSHQGAVVYKEAVPLLASRCPEGKMSDANRPEPIEPASDGQSRRAFERHPCPEHARGFSVITETGVFEATAVNIGRDGVGLLIHRSLDRGTFVYVRLPSGSTEALEMPAIVMYVSAQDPNTWRLGCQFSRWLMEAELQAVRSGASNAGSAP
jgi:hypothetical protein